MVPKEKTVGGWVVRWLSDRHTEHTAGIRSVENLSSLRKAVKHFVRFAGPATGVEAVNYGL